VDEIRLRDLLLTGHAAWPRVPASGTAARSAEA